jgi:hypothetical protein
MKRPSLVTLLVGAPVLPSIDAEWFASSDKPLAWGELALQDTITSQRPLWRRSRSPTIIGEQRRLIQALKFPTLFTCAIASARSGNGLISPATFTAGRASIRVQSECRAD